MKTPATTSESASRDRHEDKADLIQKLFARPFFLGLTIGIPFCVFKLLCGLTAVRIGADSSPLLVWAGWVVIAWASLDLMMNISRSLQDILGQPPSFEYCTIAQAGRIVGRPLVFLAFDTFLSFSIICFMLWSGWITELSAFEASLWYAATTLNLISLSLVSIYNEVRRGR